MWDINKTIQLKAFARVDGAYLGLIWIASFAFFVMQYSNPIMGTVSMLVSFMSLYFIYKRIVKFRIDICNDELPFAKAYIYSLFMFFYAALILGVAQYIYFKFIDGGFILNTYRDIMSTPEFKEASKAYGMSANEMKEALNTLSQVRPVDIVLNIMSMNIFGSIFLSIPIAFMSRKNKTNN